MGSLGMHLVSDTYVHPLPVVRLASFDNMFVNRPPQHSSIHSSSATAILHTHPFITSSNRTSSLSRLLSTLLLWFLSYTFLALYKTFLLTHILSWQFYTHSFNFQIYLHLSPTTITNLTSTFSKSFQISHIHSTSVAKTRFTRNRLEIQLLVLYWPSLHRSQSLQSSISSLNPLDLPLEHPGASSAVF